MDFKINISCGGKIFDLTNYVIDQVTFTSYLQGAPSKLEVTFFNPPSISIEEGDPIFLKSSQFNLFYGYVFTKTQKNQNITTITAYDQLRYLTIRDTISYSNKNVSQVIKMIADDFNLKTGYLESISHSIPYRLEENQKILDIIYTAMDLTTQKNSIKYIFFDDFGQLTLKSSQNMQLPLMLNLKDNILDYSYTTTIDKDVYNSVKLTVKDKKTKLISKFVKSDENTKKKWGNLQYFQRLSNDYTKAQAEALALSILNQKNRIYKTLSLNLVGNYNIRAGNLININIDNNVFNMIIVFCKHYIQNGDSTIEIDLENI